MYKICFGIVGDLATNKFIRKKEIAQLENFYLRLIDLHPGCEIFYFGHDVADYTPSILETVKVIDQNDLGNTPREYLIKYATTNKIKGISMLAFECIGNYSHVKNFIGYSNTDASASYIDCTDLLLDAVLKTVTEKTKELSELHHIVKAAHIAVEQEKATMTELVEQNKALLNEIRNSVVTPTIEQEHNLKRPTQKEEQKESAYITLLSNDNYIYYIIGLYNSWLTTNSKYKFYCLVTSEVSKNTKQILTQASIPYIEYDTTQLNNILNKNNTITTHTPFKNAAKKFSIFTLTKFDKCVYLDADMMIYKNIDELFLLSPFSAVEDICTESYNNKYEYFNGMTTFNSGLFVFKPSMELYNKIINNFDKLPVLNSSDWFCNSWHDQNILAYYNQNWMKENSLHLPVIYNWLENAQEYLLWPNLVKDIKVRHFVGDKFSILAGHKVIVDDFLYEDWIKYITYINSCISKNNIKLPLLSINLISCAKKENERKQKIKNTADSMSGGYLYF